MRVSCRIQLNSYGFLLTRLRDNHFKHLLNLIIDLCLLRDLNSIISMNNKKKTNRLQSFTLFCALSRNFFRSAYVCSSADVVFDETEINLCASDIASFNRPDRSNALARRYKLFESAGVYSKA